MRENAAMFPLAPFINSLDMHRRLDFLSFDRQHMDDSMDHKYFSKLKNMFPKVRFKAYLNELKEKNELLNNLEIILGKSELDSFPPRLEVDLTNACNLRCYMCYQSTDEVKYSHINDETISKIITILPYVKNLLIAGLGEPLLYQKIAGFLKIARHYGCNVLMITNGHFIHNHLDVFQYLTNLTISFDGATKEVFEAQRHGANFGKVIRNIKLLRKTYPDLEIILSCVVSKLNLDQIENIVQIASDLGVQTATFTHVLNALKIEITQNDIPKIKKQIEKAIALSRKRNIHVYYNDKEYVRENASSQIENVDGKLLDSIISESNQREIDAPKDFAGLRATASSTMHFQEINTLKKQNFNEIKSKINRLDHKIKEAEESIKRNKICHVAKPYCVSPWNIAFIKMNGNYRFCTYFNLEGGNICMPSNGLNSRRFSEIRNSIFTRSNMLPVCETCPDYYHREFNYQTFEKICCMYGVAIN